MRIIAGRLRRRTLHAPKGSLTRPTTDRVRESLFNLLEARMELDGADVLDLFAGSGSLGFEAISRGAAAVTFVEHQSVVTKAIQKNAAELDVEDTCVIMRGDAMLYIQRYSGPAFDLVMADPPYDLDGLERLPDLVLPHLQAGGYFALEHDRRHRFDTHPAVETSRAYGRTTVSLFRRFDPAVDEALPDDAADAA